MYAGIGNRSSMTFPSCSLLEMPPPASTIHHNSNAKDMRYKTVDVMPMKIDPVNSEQQAHDFSTAMPNVWLVTY